MVQQDPFFDLGLLEGTDFGDRTIFESFLPTNSNPLQRQQFSSLFQPAFNSFLGALGAQIKQGKAPTQSFNQHLQEQFDPQRALLRQPDARGVNAGGPTFFNFGQ